MSDASTNGTGPAGRLSGAEATELSARIAGLARAGLPLGPSLAAMADELPPGRLRGALRELARGLDSGRPLDEAIGGETGRIPAHLRGLVAAGLRSGRLGEVLGEFSVHAARGVELRRRLKLRLVYPILSLLITGGVLAFVGTTVMPQFESIFRDFGIPLPRLSIALIEFGHATAALWPTLAVCIALLGVGVVAAGLFLPPATVRGLASGIPLLGAVWRWTSLAEFFHLLGLLLEYRLPMPEALRLAGEGVQDRGLEVASRRLAEEVEGGRSLAEALPARPEFPSRLPRLVRWGEDQGELPQVMHITGEMLAERATAHATFAATILSVACFIMITLGVALVILGLFLPMIFLISRLSG